MKKKIALGIWGAVLALLLSVCEIEAQVTQTAKFSLSWTDNSNTTANSEDGSDIQRCAGANCTNFVTVGSVGPNVTTYIDTIPGDTGNITYRYQVVAWNKTGRSGASNILPLVTSAIVVVSTPPGAPTGLLGSLVGVTFP